MTNKDAIEYGKRQDKAIESRGDTSLSEARQFLNLAIKALEFTDEYCPPRHLIIISKVSRFQQGGQRMRIIKSLQAEIRKFLF